MPGPLSVSSDVSIGDLIDLATSAGEDASSHVTQIYVWRFERVMTLCKALVGAGFAVLASGGLLVADRSNQPNYLVLVVIGVSALLLLGAGSVLFFTARAALKEYVAAQSLLTELIEIRPLLRLLRFGS